MGFLNPSFQEAGDTLGAAKGWMFVSFSQGQMLAAFGPAPYRAREDFERWSPFTPSFAEGDLVLALFDPLPEGIEDFEEAWVEGPFLQTLEEAQLAPLPFGQASVEAFDLGWPGSPFAASWASVSAQAALFGAGTEETFAGWFSALAPAFTSALFAGNQSAETFAGVWPSTTSL